jgi:hypothetical protein
LHRPRRRQPPQGQAALHTDPERHDGYLLASLVDAQWENHPVAQGGQYRAQTDRLRNRGTGTGTGTGK